MSQTTPTLEDDILGSVPAIQDLVAEALEQTLGEGEIGLATICRDLGLHRKLAWQIRNLAYTPDPFAAVVHMPTRAGMDTLLGTLEGRVPVLGRNLLTAYESFEAVVQRHAGDRSQFDKLVESHPTVARPEAESKWREKSFLGNSFIWGVQARTQHSLSILSPSDSEPGSLDLVQVRGLIGLQRIRPRTRWIVGQSVVRTGADDTRRAHQPLDPEGAAEMGGVPVIREFCSRPLPVLERRVSPDGLTNDELLPAPVGATGQQTLVTGEIVRRLAPAYMLEPGERAHFGAISRTPSEVFLFDHFVHRSLFPGVQRELCVFSELNTPVTEDEADLLPVSGTVQFLGHGLHVARTADVPGYPAMLDWVFHRAHWDPKEYELHRVRIAFPPMPSTVVIRHDLPPQPQLGKKAT
ncbi:MAG: hypothetical protein R3E97_15665 [Candidatus Eisenbacteria bacterium]